MFNSSSHLLDSVLQHFQVQWRSSRIKQYCEIGRRHMVQFKAAFKVDKMAIQLTYVGNKNDELRDRELWTQPSYWQCIYVSQVELLALWNKNIEIGEYFFTFTAILAGKRINNLADEQHWRSEANGQILLSILSLLFSAWVNFIVAFC